MMKRDLKWLAVAATEHKTRTEIGSLLFDLVNSKSLFECHYCTFLLYSATKKIEQLLLTVIDRNY